MQILFINKKIEDFAFNLEESPKEKFLRFLDLLTQYNGLLTMPHAKQISKNLYELRIKGKQEIRVFYTRHNQNIYLLHGFVKKSQKIPAKELLIAKNLLDDLTHI